MTTRLFRLFQSPHFAKAAAHPQSSPFLARGFASKKGSKKKEDSDDEPASFSIAPHQKQMEKGLSHIASHLSQIHVGRANPAILEKVQLVHNGKRMSLPSVAQIHAKDGNSLVVVLPDEELTTVADKALRAADLGLNPQKVEPTTLKVPLPKMTGEARQNLIKAVRETVERGKVSIRNSRKDARTELNSLKKRLSIDVFRKHEKEIDTQTEAFVKKMDDLFAAKEKELKG
ncbi:hypothetical protein HDV03_001856 [Kappamyces sp. JEL0829]|nr:hypothetical protein HDV03_001856 [Kappamyces sp. JEL0829]